VLQVDVEFVIEIQSGATAAGPGRIAPLDHEIGNDPMKNQVVIETLLSQLCDPRDRGWCQVVKQLKFHFAKAGHRDSQTAVVLSDLRDQRGIAAGGRIAERIAIGVKAIQRDVQRGTGINRQVRDRGQRRCGQHAANFQGLERAPAALGADAFGDLLAT
jgi:hypothetical protein